MNQNRIDTVRGALPTRHQRRARAGARIGAGMLCLTLLLLGCKHSPQSASSNLPTTPMQIGSNTYTLEIAAREFERNKGLMYRDEMPADHGMIFVFANPQERSFWMRNTRIPLDILFLDTAGKVISISRMEPYDERGTGSGGMARYAIELNAGQAQAAGVKVGDALRLPDAASSAKADP